jgi:hypothetical protein
MDERDGYYVQTGGPFGPLDGYDSQRQEEAELSHGFEPEAPPRDDLEAVRAKGWTTRTIIVATIVLALLNAHSLQSWATTLPPDWGGETIRALADAWFGRTADAGLDAPRAAIHDAYDAKKGLTWGDILGR